MANTLDIEEIRHRPAVIQALERVRALTSRAVCFRHVSDWTRTDPSQPEQLSGPVMHPTDTRYDVYLDAILPEQMAVHELLHIVLLNEGYPDIKFNHWKAPTNAPHRQLFKDYYDKLVNKLQHPEIYRRMEFEYGQDMTPYRAHVTAKLINGDTFNLSGGPLSFPLGRQTAIADIIEHLYLRPESETNLDRYRSLAWNTYAVAEEIHGEMNRIGFTTPSDTIQCLNLFLDRIFNYGKKMGSKEDNKLWRALTWYLPEEDGPH